MEEDYAEDAHIFGDGGEEELSVPRGGPLYVENLTGPLTSVPLFLSSILQELQDLEVELASGSSRVFDEEDISVDELRIMTDEELVEMAIKEVLKDDECVSNPSSVPEEPSGERIAEDPQTSDHKTCNEQSRKKGMKDNEDSSKLPSIPEEPSYERGSDNPETSDVKYYKTYSRRRRRILKDDEDALNALPISEKPFKERTADNPYKSSIVSCKGKEVKDNNFAIKDDEDAPNLLSIPEEPSNERRSDDPDTSSLSVRKSRKRKGMKANSHAIERNDREKKAFWSQIEKKVEYIKKIKEKQDEDKAAVTLHSFNRSVKIKGRASASSGKVERMKPLRSASSAVKVKLSSIQGCMPVHHPEVALSIEVYHNVRSWVKTQEFLVLGQQTLTELRDKIYCSTDKVMEKDGQHNRSGYFLIEDTFYNDLRDPSAIDYSESVFDWLRNSRDDALKKWECILAGKMQKKEKAVVGDITGSKLPRFQAADMHKTQFCDLKFQVGAGYLYCHQGDCRHTIVIRDMRLLHPEDIQNRAVYPILLFQVKLQEQKCKVCRIYRATKMTVNDKWAPENPCYFCDNCYFLLHYTKDGSLQYQDFEVHDYHHDQPH
ncbi:snRNA-activating protein complex subunit-like [Argentina anserina]|uniref:snRNA-activating protein complex subunit-like n=1 Tax=Argentina anserina TaxID=57926 RepID=UPI0021763AF1|nr:snRNA-activating protein complex subunit-like [Potentilla anserina]